MATTTIKLEPAIVMTNEQFFTLCQLNRDYRMERNTQGDLIIMSPTGSETGNRNFKVLQQLANWTDLDGTGIGFDSSTGFTLPNGANRSPDAAWIKRDRWDKLSAEDRDRFAPICPDFVIELRSSSDNLKPLQDKMQEYLDNGVQLGWLIDRKHKSVYVYRPGQPMQHLKQPLKINGAPELTGFTLQLTAIW